MALSKGLKEELENQQRLEKYKQELPLKILQLLFKSNDYDYKRWHIYSVIAFYVGNFVEGEKACNLAIENGIKYNIASVELDKNNLNFYLNETCKNAMNIMDFVDSIKIQLSDVESIGELGYVNGMSKLIIKHLNALDENMRPIHCSDQKRDSLYVKDQNVWEKEGPDNNKLKKAIKYISHKNICALPEWRAKYPDCLTSESLKSDQYNRMVIEAMGGSGDNDAEKADKIVKKIAKAVTIDKNA